MIHALKGHDFKGCGKTCSGGRPGIYPWYMNNRIGAGPSPEVCFSSIVPEYQTFSATCAVVPQATKNKQWASAPEGRFLTNC